MASSCGEFSDGDCCRQFALTSPDGALRVWDTTTGALKQEYAPSSHLTATCSCISWAPIAPNHSSAVMSRASESPAKKKRKSGITQSVESLQLIAMGTTSGSMMLYSVTKAELNTQMTDSHSDKVTGICWSSNGETIYSCSVDRHIIEWDVSSASVRHRWKGDNGALYSVQICHTQRHLLSASRAIKLWDLDTRQVLQTFVGHATEVFRLCQVPSSGTSATPARSNGTDAPTDCRSIDGSYVISSAIGDRRISVWQINCSRDEMSSGSTKDVIASLLLPDDPVKVDILHPSNNNQSFQLAALTSMGKLVVFEHVLNGRQKKPMKPKCTVVMATNTTRVAEVPRPLSIVSSGLTVDQGGERAVVVVYEDFLRPVFEKLRTNEFQQSSVCLLREDPVRTAGITSQDNVSKIKTPQVSKDLTVLAPGYMAPSAPVRHDDDNNGVARKKRRKSTEMSIEERLNAIDACAPSSSSAPGAVANTKKTPKTDSLATLLEQGLQSRDKKILNNVLQRTDANFIVSTVSRLQSSAVILLIKELTRRMQGHAQSQRTVLQWFNVVLSTHKSFLTSLPDVDELLLPLRQIMYTPVELLERLMQVNTQLKSFLSQGNAVAIGSEALSSQTALSVYQDDSSDDELALEDINHEDVISEDEWENIDASGDESEEEEEEEEDDGSIAAHEDNNKDDNSD